jgi:hypothetical protein
VAAQFNPSGADYGEMYEWESLPDKDLRGYFVTFSENYPDKIRIAKNSEPILGVVTKNSGIIGNSQELAWHGSVQRDKFNQPLEIYDRLYDLRSFIFNLGIDPGQKSELELIDLLKLNGKAWGDFNDPDRIKPLIHPLSPSYNSNHRYIPRSQRPEWTCVGLLGCLVVLEENPGACSAGTYVDCSINGKAIPGKLYRVMKRISFDTVMIFFR